MGDPAQTDPELAKAIAEAAAAVDARSGGSPAPAATPPAGKAGGEPSAVEAYTAAKRELEAALEGAKKDASDLKDRWMRAAADLENYKKRAARERDEVVKFGNERLLKDLLVVLDDLDRTVQAATASAEASQLATFLEGLRMVQKKFLTQLEKNGVESFEVVGKAFDPTQHEAVQQVNSEIPAGGVAAEIRRGFTLNGRLLRPALVAVSLGPQN